MYPVAAKSPNLAKQKNLAHRTQKEGEWNLAIWLIVFSVFLSLILCVWSRAKVTAIGYEISQETRRLSDLEENNYKLRAKLAMLKAPGRLEPIAREELGLRPPENKQIVLMR